MKEDACLTTVPRVSVLMTIYNAAPFLRESIDSLIGQTFSDWELIAIENGSTDGSASILAGYTDPRIRVFPFSRNIGRTPALRRAFDEARGEYIAVLDADDASVPWRFEKEVELLDAHPDVVLVGAWGHFVDADGKIVGVLNSPVDLAEAYDRLGWSNPIDHSSAMYRKKDAVAVGGYPQKYVCAQDFALILALAQRGKIAIINEYFTRIRTIPGNMTRSPQHRLSFAWEELELMRYAGKVLSLSAKGKYLNRRTVAQCEIRYGRLSFLTGKFFPGIKMMLSGGMHLIFNL